MRKRKKTNLPLIILGIVIIVAIGIKSYLDKQAVEDNSYSVNEVATLKQSARLTTTLTGQKEITLPDSSQIMVNKYYLKGPVNERAIYARVKVAGKEYYVKANRLNLIMTNPVNQYIAQLGYPHTPITAKIGPQFSQYRYKTLKGRPRGVIIHDTGTEYSTLDQEVTYMEQNYQKTGVFVHTFIDAQQILNIANHDKMAQGAGPQANPYYVQYEMPHEYSAEGFARQTANAAYYTAYVLRQYNLPVTRGTRTKTGTIWTHAMISAYLGGTNHQDPNAYWSRTGHRYFNSAYNIDAFVELVQVYYNQL